MAFLRITTGPAQGQSVECDRELVIGREGADFAVDDGEMSRRHAVLRPLAAGLEIEDLGSLNGTFVDGQRISGTVLLTDGATLKLGVSEFTIQIGPSDVPLGSPSAKTAIRDAVLPSKGADSPPPDEPVIDVSDRTVVRDSPIVPVPDAAIIRDTPILPGTDKTAVRDTPLIPDTDRTAVRDTPVISGTERTVVRDIPPPQGPPAPPQGPGPESPPPGGPPGGFPPGGPPNIPAPIRLLMKTPIGRRLLPRLIRLSPKARKPVMLLIAVLFVVLVAAIVFAVIKLVS